MTDLRVTRISRVLALEDFGVSLEKLDDLDKYSQIPGDREKYIILKEKIERYDETFPEWRKRARETPITDPEFNDAYWGYYDSLPPLEMDAVDVRENFWYEGREEELIARYVKKSE